MTTCTLARGVPNLEEIGFLPYTVDLSEFVSSFYIGAGAAYSISHYLKVNVASEITGFLSSSVSFRIISLANLTERE